MTHTITCPICKGAGTLTAPTFKQKALTEKKLTAHALRKEGFSIREIAAAMGYKSPASIQHLLK